MWLAVCSLINTVKIYQMLSQRSGIIMPDHSVLGGDFRIFYAAGRLSQSNCDRLYDIGAQEKEMEEVFLEEQAPLPEAKLPFVYPPLVAWGLSMMAGLDYQTAYLNHFIIGAIICCVALVCLSLSLGIKKIFPLVVVLALCAGYVPLSVNTLYGGQLSWIGLAIISFLYVAMKSRNYFWAGLIMSLSYYKPPLFLILLIVFAFTLGSSFIKGFLLGGFILVGASLILFGWAGCLQFLQAAMGYTYGNEVAEGVELDVAQGAGVFGLLTQWLPEGPWALMLLILGVGVGVYFLIKTRPNEFGSSYSKLWFASVSIFSVGFSVQCIRYDLAIILPAIVIGGVALWERDKYWERIWFVLLGLGFCAESLFRYYSIGFNISSLWFLFSLPVFFYFHYKGSLRVEQ